MYKQLECKWIWPFCVAFYVEKKNIVFRFRRFVL